MSSLECPSCHKSQELGRKECKFCGLIFKKWIERSEQEFAEKELQGYLKDPKIEKKSQKDRPALETSSDETLAFRADNTLKLVFLLLLLFVEPFVQIIHKLAINYFTIPIHFGIGLLCLLFGILAGLLAYQRGYSEILTAGWAGILGGLVRGLFLYTSTLGGWVDRIINSSVVFGLYSIFTLLGGVIAWALRKYFDIQLTSKK